jgi:hypothetical protein
MSLGLSNPNNERMKTMTLYKVGLLPLYLELYDTACPEVRPRINEIYAKITDKLQACGIDLVCAPICRVKEEFQ